MLDELLGEREWRFIPARTVAWEPTKLRCQGYPVFRNGVEVGFVCRRGGSWHALPANGHEARAFKTRKQAVESLLPRNEPSEGPAQSEAAAKHD